VARADKERLDKLLVDRGLVQSRERARALVLAGKVLVDEVPVDKAGALVARDAALRLREEDHPWASRGGLKLAHALDHFGVDPRGKVCVDVGASTGGFTDVLLARGAAKVYAVDVGYGQLAWRLQQDPRVVVLDRTNARELTRDRFADPIDLAVADVAFISLTLVLPAIAAVLGPGRVLVALVKPQFEVGKGLVGKGGVVRDPAARAGAVEKVVAAATALGLRVVGTTESPVLGPAGNVEYLLCAET
jgi:23S rRNA (cytidine1920-2'-O)/16S rRNA (cytidine1409-2'-O)-methyltransferase